MHDTRLSIANFFGVFLVASAINVMLLISVAQSAPVAADDGKHLIDLLRSPSTLIQILAGSAVVTTAINIIWFFMSLLLSKLQHWWNAKSMTYSIEFKRGINKESHDRLKKLINGFYCLIVRYGTDQYVSTLASDQEKYEGRLKNEKREISINFDSSGNTILTLVLPVHKRMGTQFKCFVEAKNEELVEPAVKFLQDCDRIRDVSVSKSIHTNRIYFLIDSFGEATTIEGFKNNMIFPE